MSEVKSHATPWQETDEEHSVRIAQVTSKKPLKVWSGGINVSYDIKLKGIGRAVFKPKSGEQRSKASVTVGTYYLREAAAFRIDTLFGFGLVPITVIRTIDGEEGSVQLWIDTEGWGTGYLKVDESRLAVLDYVIGNLDRHIFNWRTQVDARPSAIDNGLCLPCDTSVPLRSRWIHLLRDRDIPEEVKVEAVGLTSERAATVLQELTIEEHAIAGAQRRLEEIQKTGQITLAAWGGGLRSS